MSEEKEIEPAAAPQLPAEVLSMLEEHEGEGTNFERDEIAIPFMHLLQPLSPQLKPEDSRYDEAAKPGMFLLTGSGWIGSKFHFIPVRFQHVIGRWKSRETGGGLVGFYSPGDSDMPATQRRPGDNRDWVVDAANEHLDTSLQYLCLFFDEDKEPLGPGILSFRSTQLKYARRLNASIATRTIAGSDGRQRRPPLWAFLYQAESQSESNQKGSWYSFKIDAQRAEFVTDVNVLREAQGFAAGAASERADSMLKQAKEHQDGSSSDDKIPF